MIKWFDFLSYSLIGFLIGFCIGICSSILTFIILESISKDEGKELHYMDQVVITDGFYKGYTGTVKSVIYPNKYYVDLGFSKEFIYGKDLELSNVR